MTLRAPVAIPHVPHPTTCSEQQQQASMVFNGASLDAYQASGASPLAMLEKKLRTARPASESTTLSHVSRSAKEEQMYSELGYLAPPNPPDELERRRALYK